MNAGFITEKCEFVSWDDASFPTVSEKINVIFPIICPMVLDYLPTFTQQNHQVNFTSMDHMGSKPPSSWSFRYKNASGLGTVKFVHHGRQALLLGMGNWVSTWFVSGDSEWIPGIPFIFLGDRKWQLMQMPWNTFYTCLGIDFVLGSNTGINRKIEGRIPLGGSFNI